MDKFLKRKLIKKYLRKIGEFTINDLILLLKLENEKRNKEDYIAGGVSLIIIFIFLIFFFIGFFDIDRKKFNKFASNRLDKIDLVINKKQKSEIAKLAKQVTVRIEGATQGSGVIIDKTQNRYKILTSWHVLKDNKKNEDLDIFTFDGNAHPWESMNVKKIGILDLATITFKSKIYYRTASIETLEHIDIGSSIYVSGFPISSSSIPIRFIRVFDGEVLGKTKESTKDGYQLYYNNQTRAGMSGGGVFDIRGKLIGIHGRTEKNDLNEALYGKISSTGVNMAVPTEKYLEFFEEQNLSKDNFTQEEYTTANSNNYLSKAKSLLNVYGKETKVIELSNKALDINITPDAYYFISSATYDLGNFKESLKNISKAIEIEPNNSDYFYQSGKIKVKLKEYSSAIIDFSKAIEIDPQNSIIFYERGKLKVKQGQYEEGILDFSKAIDLDPQTNYLHERAIVKYIISDYEGAIKDYTKLLGFLKIDPFYLHERGKVYASQGDFSKASKDFSKALFITKFSFLFNQDEPVLINFSADIKFKLKKYEEAIRDYKKSIYIEPQDSLHYVQLANAYLQLKKYQSAIEEIEKTFELDPDSSANYFLRGNIYYLSGNYSNALKDFNKAIEIRPKGPSALRSRAYTKYKLKDFKGACSDQIISSNLGLTVMDKSILDDLPILKLDIKEKNLCQ